MCVWIKGGIVRNEGETQVRDRGVIVDIGNIRKRGNCRRSYRSFVVRRSNRVFSVLDEFEPSFYGQSFFEYNGVLMISLKKKYGGCKYFSFFKIGACNARWITGIIDKQHLRIILQA